MLRIFAGADHLILSMQTLPADFFFYSSHHIDHSPVLLSIGFLFSSHFCYLFKPSLVTKLQNMYDSKRRCKHVYKRQKMYYQFIPPEELKESACGNSTCGCSLCHNSLSNFFLYLYIYIYIYLYILGHIIKHTDIYTHI